MQYYTRCYPRRKDRAQVEVGMHLASGHILAGWGLAVNDLLTLQGC